MKSLVISILTLIASHLSHANSETSIFTAISDGDFKKVQEMANSGQVNLIDPIGRTPLMIAAKNGKIGIVKVLIREGAKIDIRDKYGFTVIDQIESILRRSGSSMEATTVALRNQGISEEVILSLVSSSAVPDDPSEEDTKKMKEILKLLKDEKLARDRIQKESEDKISIDEKE